MSKGKKSTKAKTNKMKIDVIRNGFIAVSKDTKGNWDSTSNFYASKEEIFKSIMDGDFYDYADYRFFSLLDGSEFKLDVTMIEVPMTTRKAVSVRAVA